MMCESRRTWKENSINEKEGFWSYKLMKREGTSLACIDISKKGFYRGKRRGKSKKITRLRSPGEIKSRKARKKEISPRDAIGLKS